MKQDVITVVLAGGMGSRLSPLTDRRAKPAVPFGGKYRIIDFTLTNCLHSGLRRILVLTQYKSHSLQKHLRDGWSVFNPELGEYVTTVPPQMLKGEHWYSGTADAIYQNMYLLSRSGAKYVVVLSGDHIYRMDYAPMLEQHKQTGAELTVACMPVPLDEAKSFGIIQADSEQRIRSFAEKPASPQPMADDPSQAMASMGIYIFSLDILEQMLEADAAQPQSEHDFGKNIIPQLIDREATYAYQFGGKEGRVSQDSYWRDVGTLDSFYQANMDLLCTETPLDLYQPEWPIRTYEAQQPPARTVASVNGNEGIFINSIISNGVLIEGGAVQGSIIFPQVKIRDAATVSNAIVFDNVTIEQGAQIKNCIIDKHVTVPAGTKIGYDLAEDRARFTISDKGIVVVPEGYEFS
ncbi:glucose-1-phosphate adenylyltransferase [Thaumasiovibrio sp. DFM-14]|uniref:glucose-1-phosphate adenylyltransferase n=1 Tax=Thaumasiovibrio sp. DFM-14 TaxID=3384792 RepID=UPI00399FC8C6